MEDLINQLPDECLEHIFSFLPIEERLKVERVCKRWRKIGEEGWSDTKQMQFAGCNPDNMIHLILKRCGRFLRELDISLSSEHPHCLSMIMQFCRLEQLKSIAICDTSLRTVRQRELELYHLGKIFGRAKNLIDIKIDLDLEMYGIDYLNLVDSTILQGLKIINTGERVSFNPDRFPNLEYLDLMKIEINNGEMRRDEESLKGLEVMVINRCHVTRDFIERIQSFTNLQVLALIKNICDIRNNDIRKIAGHCDKMEGMHLVGTVNLTSVCFQYLGKMPSLEFLYLVRFNNVNNRDMLHLTNVKRLHFHYCPDILIDDGLIQLIKNSPNLEKLELINRDLDMNFINDVHLIFRHGQRQKHLHFRALINPTNDLRGREFPIVIDEPLLSLKVDLLKEDD